VAGSGELASAYADAYGVNIYPFSDDVGYAYPGSLIVNGTITGSVMAQGGTAKRASIDSIDSSYAPNSYGSAYGITNYGSTLQADGASLTVTAEGGTATNSFLKMVGTGVDASAYAYGINTSGMHTTSITGFTKLTVQATGGTATTKTVDADNPGYAYADAYGVKNDNTYDQTSSGVTASTLTLGSLAAEVTATAGNAQDVDHPGKNSGAFARAYGISNTTSTAVQDTNPTATAKFASADLTVTAMGGTAADMNASATGINNNASGGTVTMDSTGLVKTKVAATGGTSRADWTTTNATGIDNEAQEATVYDPETQTDKHVAYGMAAFQAGSVESTVTANGGTSAATGTGSVSAIGVTNYGYGDNKATLTVTGSTTVAATATANAATPSYVEAIGLYNSGDTSAVMSLQDATVTATAAGGNIETGSGATTTASAIRNYGNVTARNLNLTATATSYLQGNVFTASKKATGGDAGGAGTVNLTVTNGAAWRPVYDNRYGSQNTVVVTNNNNEDGNYLGNNDTYNTPAQTATTTANSIGSLTLSNGGKVDLTWDNATRDPGETARTLAISDLSGDGGIFKVNTNLAKNVADEITITNNAAANLGIDVAYDPALAVSKLTAGTKISGNAKVLTVTSGTQPKVTGVADSYNTYDYLPTVVDNGDGTFSVTGLTINNVQNTISRPMRNSRQHGMAVHNLWVNGELNNLQKRLGDLRSGTPAESGIWARYEHNKLEQGSDISLKYNMFQLGYDKDYQGETGTFYRGAAVSYAKGTGDYESASGDLKQGTLSLYQTWLGKDGRYYDLILKGGKLMSSYDLYDTATTSTTSPYSYSGDIAKNWAVFTLGGTAKAGKNCNIYGELSKFAGQLSNNVQVNIGARWSF
jgi:hypothetical protein